MSYQEDVTFKSMCDYLKEVANINIHKDPLQRIYVEELLKPVRDRRAIFVDAEAGTGKTSLAMITGYKLMSANKFERIIYVRSPASVVEMGFLPGDLQQKEEPYLTAGLEALAKIDRKTPNFVESLILAGKLVVTTSAFLRGVDWDVPSFIVIDEAQNFNLHELQTILTRAHDNSKVVIIGSTVQVDKEDAFVHFSGHKITAFELYKHHFIDFMKDPLSVECVLKYNHRGKFSLMADKINHTLTYLKENAQLTPNDDYIPPKLGPSDEELALAEESFFEGKNPTELNRFKEQIPHRRG